MAYGTLQNPTPKITFKKKKWKIRVYGKAHNVAKNRVSTDEMYEIRIINYFIRYYRKYHYYSSDDNFDNVYTTATMTSSTNV